MNPFAFHLYSEQYCEAARAVPAIEGFSPVPYQLYGISIELALKSFLLVKGLKKKELKKKLGHNLDALLRRAEQQDFYQYVSLTADERSQISRLNKYYVTRSLQYFNLRKALRGFPDRPLLPILDQLLLKILTSIKTLCLP